MKQYFVETLLLASHLENILSIYLFTHFTHLLEKYIKIRGKFSADWCLP